MVSSLEVVNKIRAYLGGQINRDSFREWIVSAELELEGQNGNADQDAKRLLANIEGRYAEFSDEVVSEEVWKKRLGGLIAPRPQSAESLFLNYFYSTSSFSCAPGGTTMAPAEASNFSTIPN